MTVARKQMLNSVDQTLKNPEFWVNRLCTLDYRGTDLDRADAGPAALRADDGRRTCATAFTRYFAPAAQLRFVVVPATR